MSRPLNNDLGSLTSTTPADLVLAEPFDTARSLDLKVELAGDLETLCRHIAAWHKLTHNVIEPSMIAAPEWQVPLYEHLRAGRGEIDVMLVEDRASSGELHGVIPFVRQNFRWGLPLPVVTSWTNDLFFIGVPLVGRKAPVPALNAALQGAAGMLGAKAAMFRLLPQSGAFAETLREVAGEQGLGIAEFEPFERAGLICGPDYETWFNDSFSRKRRKEYRRLRSRLGEQGKLEFAARRPGDTLSHWVADFLHLEQAGWKGNSGTAVACLDDISGFLNATMPAFDASSRLLFWKLTLDGKTIATVFGLICGRKAWLIKIAYDEAHARFSPGVLLMLDVTCDLLERGDIDEVDSSAVPDHPMINHLWRDRLAMTDIMIATPGTSPALFALMVSAENGRRRARNFAKSIYHRLLKRGSK